MNEQQQDILLDLLTKKAIYGLDEAEQRQLDDLDSRTAEMEFRSLEITAAAISMIGLEADEPLPAHVSSKILADAGQYLVADRSAETAAWPPATNRITTEYDDPDDHRPASSWFGWLGWAAAAAACIALIFNIWFTRVPTGPDVAQNPPPIPKPQEPTTAQLRDEMMRSATDAITATWAAGNMKGLTQLVGDVVWSDQKQVGYIRLRGLPANDTSKETYQLWIFDKTQDKATPIDGGTFNVNSDGEVVIPINAKLKAQGPEMFAITVEKPGGVVVSKRDKIAAIAKVETQAKPSA